MIINYWDCEYADYDNYWDGEEEVRHYMCNHPNGTGTCNLSNKYSGTKDDCKLIDLASNATVKTKP